MSFDPHALRRIRDEVGPDLGGDVPLTQLIGKTEEHETYERQPNGTWTNYDYDWMHDPAGMPRIAEYADGIGPDYRSLLDAESPLDDIQITPMTQAAHDAGMYVTPWTVRADQLPSYATSVDVVLEALLVRAGIDGVITDFPDVAVRFIDGLAADPAAAVLING